MKNPLAYPSIIIHRYLRIIPAYLVCIIIYWKIIPYLGDGKQIIFFIKTNQLFIHLGPIWQKMVSLSDRCEHMWRNLLFIDNLYDDSEFCFGWGWY